MRTPTQKRKKTAELSKFLREDLQIGENVQIRGREVGLALWLLKRQHQHQDKSKGRTKKTSGH
jgi:hypothetical protein